MNRQLTALLEAVSLMQEELLAHGVAMQKGIAIPELTVAKLCEILGEPSSSRRSCICPTLQMARISLGTKNRHRGGVFGGIESLFGTPAFRSIHRDHQVCTKGNRSESPAFLRSSLMLG